MILGVLRWLASAVLCALVLGLVGVLALTRLGGMSGYVVVSESMVPTLRRGDVVLVAPDDPDGYRPGDVITYAEPNRGVITHRVTGRTPDGALVTRGDANRVDDSDPVPVGRVEGRVRYVLPGAGLPELWLDEGAAGAVRLGVLGAVLAAAAVLVAHRPGRRRRDPGLHPEARSGTVLGCASPSTPA